MPAAGDNGYSVLVNHDDSGWRVLILDPGGQPAAERVCADQTEARTYASTVRQHVYWLSEPKFRQYYRLPDPAGDGRGA